MKVTELNREQIIQLKQRRLIFMADRGCYARYLNVDYDAPSYEDMARADELVEDWEIFEEYEWCEFTEDDFFN